MRRSAVKAGIGVTCEMHLHDEIRTKGADAGDADAGLGGSVCGADAAKYHGGSNASHAEERSKLGSEFGLHDCRIHEEIKELFVRGVDRDRGLIRRFVGYGANTVSIVMSLEVQCGEWRFTLSQRKSDSRDLTTPVSEPSVCSQVKSGYGTSRFTCWDHAIERS